MKLSDENVKDLFAKLDPEHTGFINYHKYVDFGSCTKLLAATESSYIAISFFCVIVSVISVCHLFCRQEFNLPR